MKDSGLSERKMIIRQERRERRRQKRNLRVKNRRCFWTRPLGHAWYWEAGGKNCVGCGKEANYSW